MNSNHFALAALSALLVAGFQARAVTLCAAGNPNTTSVAEATPTSAFVNNNDGTITHTLTGLMWKRCAQGLSGAGCATGTATQLTWNAALAATVADTTAGHADWRLPNKKELESIVESCGSDPTINQTLFPATPSDYFWSGSSQFSNPAVAWQTSFSTGDTNYNDKVGAQYVRLVRSGQSFGSFDAQHARSTLDIDGNGTPDALTDGLLIVRYLFGLRGNALITGAVAPLAPRSTFAAIQAYILSLMP